MFFSQRIILFDYLITLKKVLSFFQNVFFFQKFLLNQSMRRIFFILKYFFKSFHKSRILVELVETKQNMKKVLIIYYLSLHGLLQGSPLKSKDFLKQHFKNFFNACLLVPTHQTFLYETIQLSFTKFGSVLLQDPQQSEIMKNKF